MKETLTCALCALLIGLGIGYWIGWLSTGNTPAAIEPQIVRIVEPQPSHVDTVTRFVAVRLPLAASTSQRTDTVAIPVDSVEVSVPIERVVYEDSTRYRAVVEGYRPRLVELEIWPQQAYKPPNRRKRWHVGPSIGAGWNGHGVRPYIGVTLTYSLIGF